MKVKELIEELKKQDQNKEAQVFAGGGLYPIL